MLGTSCLQVSFLTWAQEGSAGVSGKGGTVQGLGVQERVGEKGLFIVVIIVCFTNNFRHTSLFRCLKSCSNLVTTISHLLYTNTRS